MKAALPMEADLLLLPVRHPLSCHLQCLLDAWNAAWENYGGGREAPLQITQRRRSLPACLPACLWQVA